MGLDLRERLVITLIQLCSNFGVVESHGILLRVFLSHKDLADLVGASRPRVTEHLAELEREHLLIRQGRQLIVRLDEIERSQPGSRHRLTGLIHSQKPAHKQMVRNKTSAMVQVRS